MRLLIVSDSHGNSQILDELASRYLNQVDAFVHCGDSELSSNQLIWSMMDTVAGNCDFDPGFQSLQVKKDLPFPYLIVHGHRHEVKWTLDRLADVAKKEDVDFVFYGHSHILKFDYQDGIFFINPGSIQSPRGELREKTYCILEATSEKVEIRVFNEQHHELPLLAEEWTFPKEF
ncbi:metallophosphoesterase [Jeotgalibaca caeni]|uniref:metallophosphoesterase n=1 Tax=Jeotgalibaca caeni TaxID=3028623 RepID=UPI00237E4913|nr:metallophosphoesterase [Jeotgalibaca caeni]MDE1549239.1 metallophosphoesterase [Jeotgalibaca caeni]